jgi:hypothetical protein
MVVRMIAWHYTTRANWVRVRKEGLVPMLMDHPNIVSLGLGPVFGIWTWPEPQEGLTHLGNLLFQLASKGDPRVVKLAVDWEETDRWTNSAGDRLHLKHYGSMDPPFLGRSVQKGTGFTYHDGEPSLILGRRIPPRRLHLVGDYDLVGLVSTSLISGARKYGRRTVFGGSPRSTTGSGTSAPARRSSRTTSPSSPGAP